LVSALFLGLPVVLDPGHRYVGDGRDATLAIWDFAWWPHAIEAGLNPVFTHVVWYPDGLNLTWVGSTPGLALVFTPLTVLFGAATSYNVAAVFLPAIAAWTAFLLCRRLTASTWPSLAGGFLYGGSGFVLGPMEAGHLGLTGAAVLIPLVALVLLRFCDGDLSGRRLVLLLGPLLGFQLLCSTEVACSTAIAIVGACTLGFALVPERRGSLRRLPVYLVGAYCLGGLLTAPFVYYLLTGFHAATFTSPSSYVADLLNFVVPTSGSTAGAGGLASALSRDFPTLIAQPEAYIGLPIVVIAVLYGAARCGPPRDASCSLSSRRPCWRRSARR
jgi:hypothetical protein